MKSYLLKIRGGVEVDSHGKKAGKGPLISEEVSATLGVSQDQYLFQSVSKECLTPWDVQSRRIYPAEGTWPALYAGEGGGRGYVINLNKDDVQSKQMILEPKIYGISSYSSNSMKSDNPDSGIYEAKTSRTLDLNGGNPACNQGGMIVLEGNGARPSHRGDGYLESDKMYTLNTIERHGVCYTVDQGGGSLK